MRRAARSLRFAWRSSGFRSSEGAAGGVEAGECEVVAGEGHVGVGAGVEGEGLGEDGGGFGELVLLDEEASLAVEELKGVRRLFRGSWRT